MNGLEMKERLAAVDTSNMYGELMAFPDMWDEGRTISAQIDTDLLGRSAFDHVVVAGMGGSAIGGDLMRTFTLDTAPVPVQVSRGYVLPAFVGTHSLVVISSYSGDTEETLRAFEQAMGRGASILCITSGGTVEEMARSHGYPCVRIPGGHQPRAALPYSLTCLLRLAQVIGLTNIDEDAWEETSGRLRDGAAYYGNREGNPAIDLAHAVCDHLTLVYSGPGYPEAVNLRWRGQWEENAKTLAFGNVYPELNHNEIVGWEHSQAFLSQIGVLAFRDPEDHPAIHRRMDVTREILSPRCAYWKEIQAQGESRLARMMTLIQLGGWTSLYLAALNAQDPTPVKLIDRLKAELASG